LMENKVTCWDWWSTIVSRVSRVSKVPNDSRRTYTVSHQSSLFSCRWPFEWCLWDEPADGCLWWWPIGYMGQWFWGCNDVDW
jgi:hypothetical protein